MASGSLTRWGIVRSTLLSVAGGALFGVMFASIAAGIIAAVVIAVCTVDFPRNDDVPPGDGSRTLTIDLDRR